jgi:hypothetical protein
MTVRRFQLAALFVTWLALSAELASAQQDGDDPDRLVTKVYRVADLVLPTPNYSFRGVFLPGLRGSTAAGGHEGLGGATMGGYSGGGMGGMGGAGGGMGGGGGFFTVPDEPSADAPSATANPASSARIESDRAILKQVAPPSGGGGRGMGGMMSGQVPHEGSSVRFTLDDLITAIQRSIEPNSWDEDGGPGSIYPLGNMLIISQTNRNHEQIQQLLSTLRSEGAVPRSISIEAYWLLLSDDELESLASDGKSSTGSVVKADALAELTRDKKACRAQLTCFDGQTVHVVSGNVKSLVSSLIPVVGQAGADSPEALASGIGGLQQGLIRTTQLQAGGRAAMPVQQVQAQTPRTQVGYQPVVTTINLGALLQVTPTMSDDAVVLDLQSVVVSGATDQKPVEFKDLVSLDRLDIVTQQLMTTLRVPSGRAVIAGGMTMEPGQDTEASQLYLVVRADAKEAAQPAKQRQQGEPGKN